MSLREMGKTGNLTMHTFYFYYYKDKLNYVCVRSVFLSFTEDKLPFLLCSSVSCFVVCGIAPKGGNVY